MYSRAERKFLQPAKDQANPNLGPGSYTPPQFQKQHGYAPFSSLAPRISVFEKVESIAPPPNSYDPPMESKRGVVFGRSRQERFVEARSDRPGPNAYFSSGIDIKKPKQKRALAGLDQKPVLVVPTTEAPKEVDVQDQVHHILVKAESRPKIIWKRKHVPPSIPNTHVYGYMENEEGEMVPKKPPKQVEVPEPVEEPKLKGFRFSKTQERLVFKTSTNPGPNSYNPQHAEEYLYKKQNGCGIGLAPNQRMTDEIINGALKKGVPGPGSYDIKPPLEEKLSQPRGRITFGTTSKLLNVNPDALKIPGPGQYFTEITKPTSKQKSFGSTTKRFEDVRIETPFVGYYDIKSDMIHEIQKRITTSAPFGSISNRFIQKKPTVQPGPGAYEQSNKLERPATRIQKLVLHGPKLQLSILEKVHAPVFGTQTNRFDERVVDVPPPGTYEISESFEHVKNKGRLQNSNLGSTPRHIFKVSDTPGPGTYVPIVLKKPTRRKVEEKSSRFVEKIETIPGPGAYQPQLIPKKSFNVTFC